MTVKEFYNEEVLEFKKLSAELPHHEPFNSSTVEVKESKVSNAASLIFFIFTISYT